jgi:iron complex transport system substrate-binding protein
MKFILPFLLLVAGFTACAPADEPTTSQPVTSQPATSQSERIISLGGTLTELLFDLGYGDQLVGVDVTSSYPSEVSKVPKLGHVSKLNVEGLLALRPTLVFVDADQQENAALTTLASAGIKVVHVPSQPTLDNAARAARFLAYHLDIPSVKVEKYTAKILADSLALAQTLAAETDEKPRVLFIYARGAKQLMVAGAETEASAMIELAGGENAITSFADFKPLTPEALVEAAPEVILMFASGLASLDGKAGLSNIPGISQTPAFKNDRIVAMDGHYLLGFGPRAAQAANDLAIALYPAQTK